jgi:hypothetical protein
MSRVTKEHVEQVRQNVHEILAGKASGPFMDRIDRIIEEWAGDKMTAAQACEKIQKAVSLFLGNDLAKEIGSRCALIVMRESAARK